MTELRVDTPRTNPAVPKPGGLVDTMNEYLPRRFRINHADGVVVGVTLAAVIVVVLLIVNLQAAEVWLFGFNPSVPLSVQWLISFAAGTVCALRIQHVRARKARR